MTVSMPFMSSNVQNGFNPKNGSQNPAPPAYTNPNSPTADTNTSSTTLKTSHTTEATKIRDVTSGSPSAHHRKNSTTSTTKGDHSIVKQPKAYSCIRCFERKVKCDRESPCSNCAKSNSECIFRVPAAPRRRKKRSQEEILKARLDHYEEILKRKGIDVRADNVRAEDLPAEHDGEFEMEARSDSRSPKRGKMIKDLELVEMLSATAKELPEPEQRALRAGGSFMPSRAFVSGRLLVGDEGKTRFVENNLWSAVSDEFREPGYGIDGQSSEDEEDHRDLEPVDGPEFVLGLTPSSEGLANLHPQPEHILRLWQVFLENVNPVSKVLHVPTVQLGILEASKHLSHLPKNFELLLFSIYTLAVLSLDPIECKELFHEPKPILLSRYRRATKASLSRARFLGTADLMVLQAYVLHLLAMRDIYDARTLWTLTGIANRIAEGMGVHRDGTALGLGPFETEMRRRLWWQLTFLDFRTAELTGAGNFGNLSNWNTRTPSNIDDKDIYPGMKDPPVVTERNTEMIFCLTRYELGQFWKRKMLTKQPDRDFFSVWQNFKNMSSIKDKDEAIDELERILEQKFVRFCDPAVPVEFICILVARGATNGMRLMAHHPRRYEKEEDVPESERTLLWTIATKLLELDNLAHSSQPLKRFIWHTENHFQWQAFIYVLGELTKHPKSDQADRGWSLIHEIFKNHPAFLTDIRKPLHFAVAGLTLKAWKSREDTWNERTFPLPLRTPEYITQLREAREQRLKASQTTEAGGRKSKDYFGAAKVVDNSTPALTATSGGSKYQSPAISISNVNMSPASSFRPSEFNGVLKPFVNSNMAPQQEASAHQQQLQYSQPQIAQAQSCMADPLPSQLQASQGMQQPQYPYWGLNNAPGNNDVYSRNNMNFNGMDFGNAWDGSAIDGGFGGLGNGFGYDMMDMPMQDTIDWNMWDTLLKDVRPTG